MKKCLLIVFFSLLSFVAYCQKEANNWYFGIKAGVSFETGSPFALNNSSMTAYFGTATISDSVGNLLFYTDGINVYNKNHQQMPNGFNLLGKSQSQTCMIVKKPGSETKYYVFTVGSAFETPITGLHYSIVDMEKQGGLGDVDYLFKNIPLLNSNLAVEKITAVKHSDNKSVWVIVRNLTQPVNEYHAYLVTSQGVNTQPAISHCLSNVSLQSPGGNSGQMKISPDGKYIVSTVGDAYGGTEIGEFNCLFGTVSNLSKFLTYLSKPHGVEFSSDCKFLYISNGVHSIYNKLFQYDLSLLPVFTEFLNSKIDIGIGGNAFDLQIGSDGRIYTSRMYKNYLGVINNPSEKGSACNYDSLGVNLGSKLCHGGLPQFIQTYFLRFQYEGKCAGETFTFTPNFNPLPDSIHWDFGDPGSGGNNISTELNPQHVYYQAGEYMVTVFVRYPDGRTETANRQVTVYELPQPYTIRDTLYCKGSSITLQAESGYSSYLWSNNQTSDYISVADTGFYWVEAVNSQGCIGRDTVHVQWYPVPQLTADTIISPTTCGNSIGSIRGVNIIGGDPPYNIEWLNSLGNIVGTTNDLYNLGVDNYYLWVSDGNSCRNLVASFAIQNFDKNYIIKNVTPDSTWCNQPKGKLEVEVQGGLSDRLLYTIDNWVTHQTTGVFTDLMPNQPYYVKVKDSLNCEAVYAGNPVIISSKPGVEITGHNELPEIDNLSNGSITIFAIGDSVTYSLNGQLPAQTSNVFENLVQGQYTIDVRDKHGCDSTLYITILPQTGHTLFATAGDTIVCNGLRASEPLMVSNFKEITSFEIALNYNNLLVDATGVSNIRSELLSGIQPVNYPSAGVVRIRWNGNNPVTLPDNTVLFDLVMQGKNPGLSTVNWVVANNETKFINRNGVQVPVKDSMGNVTIAPNPSIWGFYQKNVCELSPLSQMALASGGTGSLDVLWETPKGNRHGMECKVDTAKLNDSGWYHVTVIDQMNCIARDSVQVTVVPLPKANLPSEGDTLLYTPPYQLTATPGYYMYLWNTGENTNFINVTEDGKYTVIINTEEGCTDTSSVVMMNGSVEIKVPNAFTPNGDGLNDTFKPIFTKPDLVDQYHLAIYNTWGQKIYETTDPLKGWEGTNATAGVYAWVISYSDFMGNSRQVKGNVVLIR